LTTAESRPDTEPPPGTPSFFAKYIEPSDVLGECMFGLIMVLTFTLGAGIALGEGEETVRTLLIAALGCNLAWGIIDGTMYVMNAMFNRGRTARIMAEAKRAGEPAAFAMIARELDSRLAGLMTDDERSRLYRSILDVVLRTTILRTRIERDDIYGGLACATLVFLTALPAAVPFMLIDNPQLALRVSNGILIAMLFGLGYQWARHTNASRLGTGLALMCTGLALVGAAMALGG
jgi:hypothetical protein